MNLEREYYKSDPILWFPSIYEFEYEFEHEFNLDLDPGTYTVELVALDEDGKEVSGTEEAFTVEYE